MYFHLIPYKERNGKLTCMSNLMCTFIFFSFFFFYIVKYLILKKCESSKEFGFEENNLKRKNRNINADPKTMEEYATAIRKTTIKVEMIK